MTQGPDDGQLTRLLQTLPTPEPSAEFFAGAGRRYLQAIEARDRRYVLAGLVASLVGLAVIAMLLSSTVEPTIAVGWLAEAVDEPVRWTTGVGAVIALVPLGIWTLAILGSAASVLSMVLIARHDPWRA